MTTIWAVVAALGVGVVWGNLLAYLGRSNPNQREETEEEWAARQW